MNKRNTLKNEQKTHIMNDSIQFLMNRNVGKTSLIKKTPNNFEIRIEEKQNA